MPKKLKILMLHDDYSEVGGAEVLVNNKIKKLRECGHEVFFFSFGRENIDKKNLVVVKEPKSNILRYIYGVLINLEGYSKLKKVIKDFDPDIIHLHNIDKHILTFLLPIKNRNNFRTIYDFGIVCPSLWGVHKDDLQVCDQGIGLKCIRHKCISPFLYPIYYYLFRVKYYFQKKYVKGYTTTTELLKKYMESRGFKNVYVHPYFAPKKIDSLKKTRGKNILFLGRLEKNKGCEYLIRAFKAIARELPEAKLTILGSGSQEDNLKKISKESNLDRTIRFIKKVPNEKIGKYYLGSSIVVVPSVWMENSPVVIYEALSFGKPVITTDRGGNPELIQDGINGFVVSANNPLEISKAAIKLLSDDKLYKKMAQNALTSSRKFDIEKYVDNLEKIYHGLVNN